MGLQWKWVREGLCEASHSPLLEPPLMSLNGLVAVRSGSQIAGLPKRHIEHVSVLAKYKHVKMFLKGRT